MTAQAEKTPKQPDYKAPETLRAGGIYDDAFFSELWPNTEPSKRRELEEIIINAGIWYLNLKRNNPKSFTNKAQNLLIADLGKKAAALEKAYLKVLDSKMATSKLYSGLGEEYQSGDSYVKYVISAIIRENEGIELDQAAISTIAKVIKDACDHGVKIERVREGGEKNSTILLMWVQELQKNWQILQITADDFSVGEHFKQDKGRGIRNNQTPYLLHKIIERIDPSITPENIETAIRAATEAA